MTVRAAIEVAARESSTGIAEAYDACAQYYDRVPNRARDLATRLLRTRERLLRGRRIIELGCGTGLNTAWLARWAEHVVAIDASERMLEHARKRTHGTAATFVRHDVSEPWPDWIEGADVVVSVLVQDHIRDLAAVFKEAYRRLPPSGTLLLLEIHPFAQVRGSLPRFRDPDTGCEVLVPNIRHTVADYRAAAERAGFAHPRFRTVAVPGDSRPVLLESALRPIPSGRS